MQQLAWQADSQPTRPVKSSSSDHYTEVCMTKLLQLCQRVGGVFSIFAFPICTTDAKEQRGGTQPAHTGGVMELCPAAGAQGLPCL